MIEGIKGRKQVEEMEVRQLEVHKWMQVVRVGRRPMVVVVAVVVVVVGSRVVVVGSKYNNESMLLLLYKGTV